ncbi:RDD family protein [Pseudoalteromonas sp. TB64]|uniref:RDD family protein n=1 Tax=Pseudoalteromonas sp. TB64 TaxID=1938600 RepID=UPI000414F321|nr:RDD family protein [Pseudoalteromonas sp. TB64]
MEFEIDFSTYSLDDLYSSARGIDREKYPERAKEIDDLIRQKELESPNVASVSKDIGEKATRTDRLIAAIIDLIVSVVALIPLFMYVSMSASEIPALWLAIASIAYGTATTMILHGYLMYNYGQTIGKYSLSIRIENLDGTKASFTTIYFKRLLPMQLLTLVPSIGELIAGFFNPLFIFGDEKRCLHDHLAGTKVSYTNK